MVVTSKVYSVWKHLIFFECVTPVNDMINAGHKISK